MTAGAQPDAETGAADAGAVSPENPVPDTSVPETPVPGPAGPVQQSVCLALSIVVQNAAAAQQRDHILAQAVVAAGVRLLNGNGAEPSDRPAKGSSAKPPSRQPGRSPGRLR